MSYAVTIRLEHGNVTVEHPDARDLSLSLPEPRDCTTTVVLAHPLIPNPGDLPAVDVRCLDPLTLGAPVICKRCGLAGWIRAGKWYDA